MSHFQSKRLQVQLSCCFLAVTIAVSSHAATELVPFPIASKRAILSTSKDNKDKELTKAYTSPTIALTNDTLKQVSDCPSTVAGNQQEGREIQTLQPTQQLSNLEHNRIFLAFGLGLSALIVFSLLRFFYLRQRKNQQNLELRNAELEAQVRKLQESNDILRQFAYTSAHDLKEPLRNISGFVGVIQRRYASLLPEEAQEFMGYITGGVSRMNNLLSGLLQYSTIQMEKQQTEHESVDIEKVITDVKDNLQLAIVEKNATVQCLGSFPKIGMSYLHSTQLFQNLISNSLKFVTETPIVQIGSQQTEKEVIITVQDNGIGMKQEYNNKVFQLFQRLRASNEEGNGVGLTICKNIVEKYNGKIWFESTEGHGTCFFISLPKAA
jgi:signal transduction histidine kinase